MRSVDPRRGALPRQLAPLALAGALACLPFFSPVGSVCSADPDCPNPLVCAGGRCANAPLSDAGRSDAGTPGDAGLADAGTGGACGALAACLDGGWASGLNVVLGVPAADHLAIADFNGDGRPDFAVSSAASAVEYLADDGGFAMGNVLALQDTAVAFAPAWRAGHRIADLSVVYASSLSPVAQFFLPDAGFLNVSSPTNPALRAALAATSDAGRDDLFLYYSSGSLSAFGFEGSQYRTVSNPQSFNCGGLAGVTLGGTPFVVASDASNHQLILFGVAINSGQATLTLRTWHYPTAPPQRFLPINVGGTVWFVGIRPTGGANSVPFSLDAGNMLDAGIVWVREADGGASPLAWFQDPDRAVSGAFHYLPGSGDALVGWLDGGTVGILSAWTADGGDLYATEYRPPVSQITSLALGDLDGDGKMDLAMSASDDAGLRVIRGE